MVSARPWGCMVACAITVIASIIMLIFSSISINQTYYLHNIVSQIYSLSIFTLCISIFTIIFACGLIYIVLQQYPALTTIFSGLLLLMAFLAVTCGILLIIGRRNVVENTYTQTAQIFYNYSDSNIFPNSQNIVVRVQQTYKCCGVGRATDWKYEYPDQTSTPDSCCRTVTPGCGQGALITQDKIYLRGCAEPILYSLKQKFSGLISLVFIIMVFSIVAATLGITYERSLEQQYQMM